MVANCFERRKLGKTSFVRIRKAKDGFAPRPQPTVNKQLEGDQKFYLTTVKSMKRTAENISTVLKKFSFAN